MKKAAIIFLSSCLLSINAYSQFSHEQLNDLRQQFLQAKTDSSRMVSASQLAIGFRFSNIDSSLFYTNLAISFSEKLDQPIAKATALSLKGATVLEAGKIPESLQLEFEALAIGEKIKDTNTVGFAFNRIGNVYMELADYKKANEYYLLSKNLFYKIGDTAMFYNEVSNIGNVYALMHMPDSALYFQQIVYDAWQKSKNRNFYTQSEIMFRMGNAYRLKGDKEMALTFYKRGIVDANIDNDLRNLTMNNLFIAELYHEQNIPDSAMKYAYNTINIGKKVSFRKGILDASLLLSKLFYEKDKYDSAYTYLSMANVERDSLTGEKRFQDLQRILLDEQEKGRLSEEKRIAIRNRQKQYALLSGLGIFLIIAGILYTNNRQKQKTNKVLESTLSNLKSTQSQLIQSEKMASLGELTAGIAHEIQNPLNFVNNFSEVNKEMLEELKAERLKPNAERDEILEGELINDVIENSEKINHHGKRAGDIVKGILQHSRSSTGVKEPTDINALADEYLRLTYQGLRAKDKTFNAEMKTDFDESIGKINIIPQDIGRVLLNLYNNAFYAVTEKAKLSDNSYQPTVSVKTKRLDNHVLITVSDNGGGIPQNIANKIFQPFFTTKPTGSGTGLGLSLSYDIVKAHGGELKSRK
ncbi:MAG TPA: ATP-binding protein [Hanamia sp.]